MFSTITAKYAGTCKRCAERISAGQRIRYGGRGLTYHLKAECPAGQDAPVPGVTAPEPSPMRGSGEWYEAVPDF